MLINTNGNVAKAFRASHKVWRKFCGDYEEFILYPTNTNLCTLMQTILIRAPLAILANVIAITSLVVAVGYLFWLLFLGGTGTLMFLVIVGVCAVLVAIGLAVIAGIAKFFVVAADSEAVNVTLEYIKAKKSRICPLVKFTENKDEL